LFFTSGTLSKGTITY